MRTELLLVGLGFAACTPSGPRSEPVWESEASEGGSSPVDAAAVNRAAHWYWDEGLTGTRMPNEESYVVSDDGTTYTARHPLYASGAELTRSTAQHEVVWHLQLRGAGPLGHALGKRLRDREESAWYRNELRLALEGGNPVVFGNETDGKYTEVVDAVTGMTIAHGVPPSILAEAEWSFDDGEEAIEGPWSLPVVDGSYVFTEAGSSDRHAVLVRLAAAGGRVWRTELPGNSSCGRAALREIAERLWVVRWCATATGADLLVVDPMDGTIEVSRRLRALPYPAGSPHLTRVQLRELGGYPVVFGDESSGRYLEALHPVDGTTLVSRTGR